MEIKRKLKTLLSRLDLSDNEAEFYLLVHRYARSLSLKEISQLLRISSSTAYRIYDKLRERGLVISSPTHWRKSVVALPLSTFADKLNSERGKLARVEYEFRNIDSLLNLNRQAFSDNSIEILTEEDRLLEKYSDILYQDWDHLTGYGSATAIEQMVGRDLEMDFIKKRVKKGRNAFACFNRSPFANLLKDNDEKHFRNTKLITNSDYENSFFYIHGDEVSIWSNEEEEGKKCIVMKDPLLVKTFRQFFEYNWKQAA